MKDIEILRKGLDRSNLKFLSDVPANEYYKALERIERLLKEAPGLFRYDLNKEKLDWLKRAGQLEDNKDEPGMIIRS